MSLTDEQKMSYYLELYKQLWHSFDARRAYQWKFNFGLWAAIAILIGQVIKGDVAACFRMSGWWWLGIHVALFLVYLFWCSGIHSANDRDRDYAYGYKDAIESALAGSALPSVGMPKRRWVRCLFAWSPLTSLAITGGLLSLSITAFWERLQW